ncbi:probable LRR receptor-like serine/threonine-protein kinase At4g29180 [Neltuma alba]|uniref:probable LRR receptor-like serine/threonine-protein kinase At4g29180 n=1 Tax=Neltuma alba TaxID=207710 RepID=UPI0010A2CE26|nr:probable LRR receptor-like serine/threonine-protein kinase At4g29180 [Prosopis alba]
MNQTYLIRAIFSYGNYDNKNTVPVFDLYFGANYWITIRLPNATYFQFEEIILQQLPSDHLFQKLLAEIQKLPSDRKRIINVTFDDDDNSSPAHLLTLQYLKPVTLSSNKISKGYVSFTIIATADSDAPPILNAYEIYEAISQPNSPPATQDVDALLEIKHTYGISRFSWDLSNNELAGQLPEFLSTLLNLKFNNLAGNKLTGSIPNALKENAELQLSVANNPGLCQKNSCQKHNFVIPLIASVAALVILIVIVALVIWRLRHKRVILRESQKREAVKHKNQSFSYSEVLRITNNFETAIGEGGFGKVYLGTLEDDTKVSVKLLSPYSRQGFKEFQSEAQLLTVIHHRNLVSFVGFCDENDIKALVYEYMDLGDLSGLLAGHPPVRRELEDICFIIDWICPKIEWGDIRGIVDLRLAGEFNVSSAWNAVETAMSCIAPQCAKRPDISYVLHELKECLAMEIDFPIQMVSHAIQSIILGILIQSLSSQLVDYWVSMALYFIFPITVWFDFMDALIINGLKRWKREQDMGTME